MKIFGLRRAFSAVGKKHCCNAKFFAIIPKILLYYYGARIVGQRYLREHILDCANQQLYDMANVQRYEHQLYRCRYVAVGICAESSNNL